MTRWIPYAMVRITVFFMAGIVVALYFPELFSIPFAASVLAGLITLYLLFFILHRRGWRKMNPGIAALPAVFIAGYLNLIGSVESHWPNHISSLSAQVEMYEVVLVDFAHEKERSWKQLAAVTKVKANGVWSPRVGNVLLYFSKSKFDTPFKYGDHLLIRGTFSPIAMPSNPGEFDYKKYLSYQQVYHQHVLYSDPVRFIKNNSPSYVMDLALAMRKVADEKLKSLVEGEREKALASALVLGVVDGLDNELLNAYAATGAMHVLAVSGLHVGILYWLLLIILKPLKNYSWGRWFTAATSLFILWTYACITGLSPSVLRAVVMFSFASIAFPLNFRSNVYNILAASAFCLMLYDPFMIVSVGFQLSYLAVLGIVYLQPLLYRLIEFDNRIPDETWKITCVAVAAQLSTFMLGLLYFHQFPNYFLISNLFVIPLSFVILMTGLTALLGSFITALGILLGYCLTWLIRILNYLVFWVESWPYSLIENIYVSPIQAAMLGVVVLFLCAFLERQSVKYLFWSAFVLTMFSVVNWYHFHSAIHGQRLIVYNIQRRTVFDLLEEGRAYAFADTDTTSNARNLDFTREPYRLLHGVSDVTSLDPTSPMHAIPGGIVIVWRGITIVRIVQPGQTVPSELQPDFLILSGNSVQSSKEMVSGCNAKWIIIDSSYSKKVAGRLMDELKKNVECQVHSVWHQGPFEVKL